MWNGTLLWQNLGCRRELLRRRTVSPHVSLWILTLAMGTALQVPLLGFSFPSYKQSKLVTSQRACSDPRNLSCPVALTNCLTSARHPLFPLSSCSSCPPHAKVLSSKSLLALPVGFTHTCLCPSEVYHQNNSYLSCLL